LGGSDKGHCWMKTINVLVEISSLLAVSRSFKFPDSFIFLAFENINSILKVFDFLSVSADGSLEMQPLSQWLQ
jgi:hypothetical protein